jgi:protein tyrosine phosphatase
MNNGNSNGFFKRAQDVFDNLNTTKRVAASDDGRDRYGDIGSTSPMRSKRLAKMRDKILEEGEQKYLGSSKVKYDLNAEEKAADLERSEYITKGGRTINASKVIKGKGYSIIATQCPKPSTLAAFMDLILTSKISLVVCLCVDGADYQVFKYWDWLACQNNGLPVLFEGGNGRGKAWTRLNDNNRVFRFERGPVGKDYSFYSLSIGEVGEQLKVSEKKNVNFILYSNWPDKNLPKNPAALERLLTNENLLSERKLLVHCSAGVGRTGVFCGCFEAMKEIKKGKDPDPEAIVNEMREYRTAMVQTPEQYDFLCRFIIRNSPKWKNKPKLGWNDDYNYYEYFGNPGPGFRGGIYEGKADNSYRDTITYNTDSSEYTNRADIYGTKK